MCSSDMYTSASRELIKWQKFNVSPSHTYKRTNEHIIFIQIDAHTFGRRLNALQTTREKERRRTGEEGGGGLKMSFGSAKNANANAVGAVIVDRQAICNNIRKQCQGKRNCAWISKQCNFSSRKSGQSGCEFNSI